MTCLEPVNDGSFVGMKHSIADVGGGVIVAMMFLAVFVGGANAGDYSRSQSAEALLQRAITELDQPTSLR